jgi:hypothetical protein
MIMLFLFFILIVLHLVLSIYGIADMFRRVSKNQASPYYWIVIISCLPMVGAALYFGVKPWNTIEPMVL